MKRKSDLVLGSVFTVLSLYYVFRAVSSITLFAIPKLCFGVIFCVLAVRFFGKYLNK